MTKFIAILSSDARPEHFEISKLLGKECQRLNLDYTVIDPLNLSSENLQKIKKSQEQKILYRISPKKTSRLLEYYLYDKNTTTFFGSRESILVGGGYKDYYSIQLQEGLKEIPITELFPASDKLLLSEQVNLLGGYPIIAKITDASHGIGVYKINNWEDLTKITDKLKNNQQSYILQEYIESANTTARVIVLGDKIVDSIVYTAGKDSFISNLGDNPDVKAKKFSEDIENLALRATRQLDLEFAGIDISFGEEGNKILEVNYPCNFLRAQNTSGTNIARQMVEYLVNKLDK